MKESTTINQSLFYDFSNGRDVKIEEGEGGEGKGGGDDRPGCHHQSRFWYACTSLDLRCDCIANLLHQSNRLIVYFCSLCWRWCVKHSVFYDFSLGRNAKIEEEGGEGKGGGDGGT
jgi:hypothetical protein